MHKRDLEADVASETSGDFKRLMVSMLAGSRSEDTTVDEVEAKRDAQELYEAGEKTLGTDESVFNKIFCVRSYPQLLAVFDEYKSIAGKEIEESLESELSGDLKRGMLAIGVYLI